MPAGHVAEVLGEHARDDPEWQLLAVELIESASGKQARWRHLQMHCLVPIELRLVLDWQAAPMSPEAMIRQVRLVARRAAPRWKPVKDQRLFEHLWPADPTESVPVAFV